MSKKKIVQIIAITLLLVALILLMPYTKWKDNNSVIGFISLVLATFGSIISIFIPTGYSYSFKETDWRKSEENDFELTIKSKKHGIGNSPQIQVFRNHEGSFEEVEVSSKHKENGTIIINASISFNGKVIVK